MNKKKTIIIVALIIWLLIYMSIITNKTGKAKTPYNAYPATVYFNDVQLEDTYIYKDTCFISMEALVEGMGFDFEYEPFDPVENLGEGYFNPYEVYGTFTISNDINTVVMEHTDNKAYVYRNGENISKKIQIKLINDVHVEGNIEWALERNYTTKDCDLKSYLKKDVVYVNLRGILEALDNNYRIDFDETTSVTYVYGD